MFPSVYEKNNNSLQFGFDIAESEEIYTFHNVVTSSWEGQKLWYKKSI